jgi:hypothetical protein
MSEIVIFGIGVLVFLITIYGSVISGGLFLTRRQLADDPMLRPPPDGRNLSIGPLSVPDDY